MHALALKGGTLSSTSASYQNPSSDFGSDGSELSLDQVKDLLANQLCDPERLKRPEGLATSFAPLDQYLLWSGLPKGGLTLLCGSLGTGATSLWIETAAGIVGAAEESDKGFGKEFSGKEKDTSQANRWVAWINGEIQLAPQSLYHKGMNLKRFVCVEQPPSEAKLFWLLQEMMSSSLFELIGCDLGTLRLREHQLRKLQSQAREAHVALVLMSQLKPYRGSAASVFSLIVHFEKKQIVVERALHRPTPHKIARSVTYARFTLHTENRVIPHGVGSQSTSRIGTADSPDTEPGTLS